LEPYFQNHSFKKANKREVILIVDDETSNRLLLNTYLKSAGYEVIVAKSGEEAIEMIRFDPPSAVILDVMLPKMNGFEVCKYLKESRETYFIPVILVTALRGNDERLKGSEVGADDFIAKPFNRIELLTRIKSLLRIKRLHETLHQKVDELEKTQKKLKQMAVTDGLTGLHNYRAFRNQLHMECSRSDRFGLPFSLLMLDIDHFKKYNDSFGHPNGDKVLRRFARLLYDNIREVDFLARYGGEEFVLILPGTDKNSAVTVSEKLRNLVEHCPFPHEKKSYAGRITMSAGIASYPLDTKDEDELIQLSDQALYKAKKNGRNCTATA
jgi:diguanylate cyclase (GGDEF)-like protein